MPTATSTVSEYTPNLQVKPKDIPGLSEKLLEQHWKLYEGYVKNTNALNKAILEAVHAGKEANEPAIAELQRRFGFEYNGMVLHEYYFGGMKKGVKELPASSPFQSFAGASYGSYDRWKKNFIEVGKMRGVGWAVTYFDPTAERLTNVWVSDHEVGHIAGFIPLIIMDCWEHAFILDYGATPDGRGEYVKTYVKNINWEVVEERFAAATEGKLISRAISKR